MPLRNEDVVHCVVVAARAAQAQHMPGIEDRGVLDWHPEYARHRGAGRCAHWLVAIPEHAGAHQPTRMVHAACEIPATVAAVATIDAARAPLRSDRTGKPQVG